MDFLPKGTYFSNLGLRRGSNVEVMNTRQALEFLKIYRMMEQELTMQKNNFRFGEKI